MILMKIKNKYSTRSFLTKLCKTVRPQKKYSEEFFLIIYFLFNNFWNNLIAKQKLANVLFKNTFQQKPHYIETRQPKISGLTPTWCKKLKTIR